MYTYVTNNPLIYSDPSGHRQEWGSGGIGGTTPKSTWVKAGEGLYATVDMYTGGAISDYVNDYSGKSWSAKQFIDAGGIFIQFIPISAAEAKVLSVGQTAEKAGVSLIQKAGQWIKVVFKGEANFVKVNNDIIRSSATAAKKGGKTVVGHALQKHAGRNPNIWGKIKGGSEQINQTALNQLNDILNAPGGFTNVTNSNGVQFLEKTLQDGRGVRLNLDGTFKGFIDQ